MARIPEVEIERLKSEISVERLVEASGIELKRAGRDLLGRCPFHDDHGPSLVISPKKNLWHCLGACQTGGSVIDWVMKINGVSFRHAVEILREGIVPLAAGIVKQSTQTKTKRAIIRNRIYDQVFDTRWIRAHMPDAEIRRQRMALRQGFVRASLIWAAVATLLWFAYSLSCPEDR